MNLKSSFALNVTMVSNEFIDHAMAQANGEYIKEYLYVLRHQGETISVSMIADALNHTEADVGRALAYWQKAGVLAEEERLSRGPSETACAVMVSQNKAAAPALEEQPEKRENYEQERDSYSPEKISSLAGDEDFSQLLYIAQKYMNKVFTQRECQIFAYLYDGLHMSAELLEYVVEYCVQGGHSSIRYIETVAISWHEKGLKTVDQAKAYASSFSKDSFAVMRAFGLNDRKPGDTEREMMDKWFRVYGFTRELVLEACNRTMEATHTPSFKYADKILSQWKKAKVRSMTDVRNLDEQHAGRDKKTHPAGIRNTPQPKPAQNQFQNFPQRDIDYDALVLQQLKEQ